MALQVCKYPFEEFENYFKAIYSLLGNSLSIFPKQSIFEFTGSVGRQTTVLVKVVKPTLLIQGFPSFSPLFTQGLHLSIE